MRVPILYGKFGCVAPVRVAAQCLFSALVTAQGGGLRSAPDGSGAPGWSIQAASFSDPKSARALADKLEQAGFNVGLSAHKVKGRLYYQVRVGPYSSEKLARDAAPGVARISNTKVLVRAPGSDNG